MSKKSTIKISCETPELKGAMMEVLLMSKTQLTSFLGQALSSKGIKSDIRIKITGDSLDITQKSGDKGIVIVSTGVGFEAVGYDTLQPFDKYMIVRDGVVSVYVKTPDNVDAQVARFGDLEDAVANIKSNDVQDATANIKKLYETKKEEVIDGESSTVEEIGNTSEVI